MAHLRCVRLACMQKVSARWTIPCYFFRASGNIILCAQPRRSMTTFMATQAQEQDETDLARQALQDMEPFAELYRPNLNRVYCYHRAHTGNPKDAEDLTSQTFVAALE